MTTGPLILHTHCVHPAHRIAQLSAKCSDLCSVTVNGNDHDGYVPDDMGIGGGDYVSFNWCLECGAILGEGWPKHTELEQDKDGGCIDCDCRGGDDDPEDPNAGCCCDCHEEE